MKTSAGSISILFRIGFSKFTFVATYKKKREKVLLHNRKDSFVPLPSVSVGSIRIRIRIRILQDARLRRYLVTLFVRF